MTYKKTTCITVAWEIPIDDVPIEGDPVLDAQLDWACREAIKVMRDLTPTDAFYCTTEDGHKFMVDYSKSDHLGNPEITEVLP
jgi:hypothetical protein